MIAYYGNIIFYKLIGENMGNTSLWKNSTSYKVDGVTKHKPEYTQWYGMKDRVERGVGNYRNVKLSENLKSYDFWCDWVKSQKGFGNRESSGSLWAIDKDIVGDGSIYHEDVCVFVPQILNVFLTQRKPSKLPRGVNLNATGRYMAKSSEFKEEIRLGVYDTVDEALFVYQERRLEYLFRLMDIYGDDVDDRVFPSLLLNLTDSFVVF